MTFAVPRHLGRLAFVLGVLPAIALAETAPSGRTWTDPPARGSAEARPAPAAEAPVAAPPVSAEAKRPTQAAVRVSKRARPYTEARVRVTRHAASAPRRSVVRTLAAAPAPQDRAVRRITMRPTPYAARPPVIRYSYGVAPDAAGSFVYEDDRARRVRQAQEAGYLVVRSRSVEFPDGRRLRTYRPVEEDSDD